MLGISGLMERLPRQLSGGQQQRVALGRAVVREPEVFLMDEPLSNLDARLRVETRGELVRLYRRLGATIVYVTHDQTEAMTMGTKIAVLHHGVLQQVGTPWEIFDRPVNQFVAGFMGETRMNFIHGELSGAQDAMTMRAGTVNLPVPQTFLRARNVDGRGVISLGVRPEHFELTEPGTGDLTGRVELYERLGSRALLTVLSGDLSLVVEAAAHRETPLGSTVGLAVNWRHAHVFDTDSGATLLPPMAPVG